MVELSKKRKGKIGELIITKKLLDMGFDVYDNIVDDKGIDIIVRNEIHGKIKHNDIQVKHSKHYEQQDLYWFGLSASTFRPYSNLYIAFVLDENRIFVIPSIVLQKFRKQIPVDKQGNYKITIKQRENWGLVLKRKKPLNIDKYLNNFKQLEA
ncbi:MAG: hypothetical protein QXL81_02815 [Candidatus Aenigmatarchaeota archaeon]